MSGTGLAWLGVLWLALAGCEVARPAPDRFASTQAAEPDVGGGGKDAEKEVADAGVGEKEEVAGVAEPGSDAGGVSDSGDIPVGAEVIDALSGPESISDSGATDVVGGDMGTDAISIDTSKDAGEVKDTTPGDVPGKPCDGKCTSTQFCDLGAKACKDVTCGYPTKWSNVVQKVSTLAVTAEKALVAGKYCKQDLECEMKLGQNCNLSKGVCQVLLGCDLNGDGKNDNVFGKILGLDDVNKQIKEQVADGTTVILFDPSFVWGNGTKFAMNQLVGVLDMQANNGCDVLSDSANCKYTVSKLNFDHTKATAMCPALVVFDNTKVANGNMTAYASKSVFTLNIGVGGVGLALKISLAQLFGKAIPLASDPWVSTKDGHICGVLTKQDLDAAIDAVPDETFSAIGLDKATMKGIMSGLLKPDIDTDGDATKDAISVSLDFETVKGQITGLSAEQK